MTVVVAAAGEEGRRLAVELRRAEVAPVELVDPATLSGRGDEDAASELLSAAEAIIVFAEGAVLTPALVQRCDRAGVRIVPVCRTPDEERRAAGFGLPALPADADGWILRDAVEASASAPAAKADPSPGPRIITVWGAGGAPGRSTIAIELAAELARGRRQVALVDADSHTPSIALTLGLADEAPGFAAACRQADRGSLDVAELDRISQPVRIGGDRINVLTGINRPSRWPELGARRVGDALAVCRGWAQYTVVDVAASLERDEEIMSDLTDGPRRNAATAAALAAADHVVAVVAADPLGIARFLRAHAELRATIGATRISVVANRLRPGALGLDARGQVRRALERFAGVHDVWFVPQDARAADAALLAATPVAASTPRSPLTLAIRRFAGEAVTAPGAGGAPPPAAPRRRSRRRRGVGDGAGP